MSDMPNNRLAIVLERSAYHAPLASERRGKNDRRVSGNDYPAAVLFDAFSRLGAGDLQNARLSCKAFACIGASPSLPGWQELLRQTVKRAKSPQRVFALLTHAAKRGNLSYTEHLALACLRDHHAKLLVGIFVGLPFNRLRRLDMSGSSLGEKGAEALLGATHLASLRDLDFWGNYINDRGAQALAEATHLVSLQDLTFGCCNLGDAGAQALAGATHLTSLRILDLRCNCVGDAGAQALAGATHLTSLQYLDLRDNWVGDAGAQAFAGATHLTSLRHLDLRENNMFDVGDWELANALHLEATLLL